MNEEGAPAEKPRHFCAFCQKPVDPLRAARVRFSQNQTHYFCCREHAERFHFKKAVTKAPLPIQPEDRPLPSSGSVGLSVEENQQIGATGATGATGMIGESLRSGQEESVEPPVLSQKAPVHTNPRLPSGDTKTDADEDDAPEIRDSLLPSLGERDTQEEPSRLVPLGEHRIWLPVGTCLVAAGLMAAEGEDFWPLLASAILLALSFVWGQASLKAWDKNATERAFTIGEHLAKSATRLHADGSARVPPDELRPGDEIVVAAGEWIAADGTVSGGEARVRLWEGSGEETLVQEGSRVAAGGQVLAGECSITCSKTGKDRALFSLVARDDSRLDRKVFATRLAHLVTGPLAPLAGALVAGAVWLEDGSYASVIGTFGAAWGSLCHPVARQLPGVMTRKWLMRAARHGIGFAHARLVDLGGHVTTAIFCVRGTLLHGQPEVAEVHPLRDISEAEILALAAGAESVVHHPVAAAVMRAAEVRGVNADTSRSHNAYPGSGVSCISARGDLVVLGSRELLLRERISVAIAEETLRRLESRGLSALLLAKNDHLIGVLALQDSLRAGAKASIQLLLDEGIEPVLLSSDSRATTEAVAHALAVEHVRPEVATAGRAAEVKSLMEAGSNVAVIGTSPRDDAALGAAPVPIVLEGASIRFRDAKRRHDRSIGLIGDQVLTASLALLICRRIKHAGTLAWTLSLLPALLGTMSVASQLVPVFVAPLLSTAGVVAASWLCLRVGPQIKAFRAHQDL